MTHPGTVLAAYAAHPEHSRGRIISEAPSLHRTEFQRDRDRIIHSTAFRRLEYKTQVFVNHEGDLYRTRLTHSLEVAQVGRTVARALGLNEDLCETICLAHDLGHTPFGHAGQDELNKCMRDYGGFEHNLQSLRVVDVLEEKYPGFVGLNLTFEAREGILKHCARRNARELGDLGRRFLDKTLPGGEAQLADLADSIAYNHHDVDDGLRSGLITAEQLCEVELFGRHYQATTGDYPDLDERRHIYETVRRMFGEVIDDLITCSRDNIRALGPATIDDIRNADQPVLQLSAACLKLHLQLKEFLRKNLYRHERVVAMTDLSKTVVRELFTAFFEQPERMPADFAAKATAGDINDKARIVADFIAGMTDRYALTQHRAARESRAL
ncbi:MAG: deoxyguanosinetriphosphate triphosphohydrolase [Gammaproteobacteria bacterium]|nr:deoxyguanosinetriphosphate triphosphohydrolase [Gammaproteobacteria bacterium]